MHLYEKNNLPFKLTVLIFHENVYSYSKAMFSFGNIKKLLH